MNRYIIGLFITVGLLILLIVLIVHGGGKSTKVPNASPLPSYSTTDATVRLTMEGPINAPQNHNKVQVTVGKDSANFELLKGYDGNVTKSQSYSNTQASYNAFLHALEHSGFTKGNNAAALRDESGYCPAGNRYVFELIQIGKDLERYWTTNCGGTPKSFGGNTSLNISLFKAQIPGYIALAQDVNL